MTVPSAHSSDGASGIPTSPTSGPAPASGDTTIRMGIPEAAAIGSAEPSVRLPDHVRSIVEALPAGCALLVVPHDPHAGARFLLDTDTPSVGRHPSRRPPDPDTSTSA